MKKVISILILISMALPFSLFFTNQASATTCYWPPTVTTIQPTNNSWGVTQTPDLNFTIRFPGSCEWELFWYWGTYSGGSWSYTWLGMNYITGNQTPYHMPWAATGFNGGIPIPNSQYCSIQFMVHNECNSSFKMYTTFFHVKNATAPTIPYTYSWQNRTIGSVAPDLANLEVSLDTFANTQSHTPRFVESQYQGTVIGRIKNIQLAVYWQGTHGASPPTDLSIVSQYHLWLSTGASNIIDVGYPTSVNWSFYPPLYVPPNDEYSGVMIWANKNISVNNGNVVANLRYLGFEFKDDLHSYTSPFISVRYGNDYVDINNDGSFDIWLHCNTQSWCPTGIMERNQVLTSLLWGDSYFPGHTVHHDLGWSFTIAENITLENPVNNLGVNGISADGKKQYQPIYIQYNVNDEHLLVYPSQINVTCGGVAVTNQSAPYPIQLYQGTYIYIPQVAGTYVFSIRNQTAPYALTASTTVTVTANTESNWIESIPAMGSIVTPVLLRYRYLPKLSGSIGVFLHSGDTNDFSKAIDTIGNVSTTASTGNKEITYNPPTISYPENRIYYRLFCTNLTTPEPLGSVAVFEIYTTGQTALRLTTNPLLIGPKGAIETVMYSHNYVGATVGIFMGPSLSHLTKVYEVGDKKYGSVDITIQSSGDHYVAMQVLMGTKWTMIANQSINITYIPGYTPPTPSPTLFNFELDFQGWIGPIWSGLLGLIIVLLCLCIPLILDAKYKLELPIPQLTWTLFGLTGIAISVVLGLWAIWVIVFMITMTIIVAFFIYIYRTSARSEQ